MVEQAVAALGGMDILVNNAGIERNADFVDVTERDYRAVIGVDMDGPFFVTQAFARHRVAVKQAGKVINISSVHEELPFPHFTAYCMAKGGLKMMMRNLAIELAPLGITVNNIAPGAIETPINAKLLNDPKLLNPLLENIPLRPLGARLGRRGRGHVSGIRRRRLHHGRHDRGGWRPALELQRAMSYQPIEHYGVIGDMRTAALVGAGWLDRLVLPSAISIRRAYSPRSWTTAKADFFRSRPSEESQVKQMYLPNTNVLVTRFFSDSGMGEVTDFMSVGREAGGGTDQNARQIIRIARAIRGPLALPHGVPPGFRLCARGSTRSNWGRMAVRRYFLRGAAKFALKSTHAVDAERKIRRRRIYPGRRRTGRVYSAPRCPR